MKRNRKTEQDTSNQGSQNAPLWIAAWFAAVVSGVLSFILLFERRRTRTRPSQNANPEPEAERQSRKSAPDDEPGIFNLRNFGWFAGVLVMMVGFVLLTGALLSGFFLPGRSIVATPLPTLLPPEPRLQTNGQAEFQSFQATQQAELNTYNWIDRQNGIVHIPIERAMELLAAQNLPVATGTPVATTPRAP